MNKADVKVVGKDEIRNAFFRIYYQNNTNRNYYLKPEDSGEKTWKRDQIPTDEVKELNYELTVFALPGTGFDGTIKRSKKCTIPIKGKTNGDAFSVISEPKICPE